MLFLSNATLLILHAISVSSLTLFALYLGKEAIVSWLSLLAIAINFFVLKQVTLLGLEVTCSDALAVGYLLGLNLIQEFFGNELAKKTIWITFFISLSFAILSQIHLLYQPNSYDLTHSLYDALLKPLPRLFIASLCSFFFTQQFDLFFFSFLRKKFRRRWLTARTGLCLIISQCLDTTLFSFLGLYGLVSNLTHVILFALAIKGVVTLLTTPFIFLSKRVVPNNAI